MQWQKIGPRPYLDLAILYPGGFLVALDL